MAAYKPESSAEKDTMEVLKKEGNMRRESSVLVPSSFQIAIAADRVLERLMLNLNVVTVIPISHVLNPRIRVRT